MVGEDILRDEPSRIAKVRAGDTPEVVEVAVGNPQEAGPWYILTILMRTFHPAGGGLGILSVIPRIRPPDESPDRARGSAAAVRGGERGISRWGGRSACGGALAMRGVHRPEGVRSATWLTDTAGAHAGRAPGKETGQCGRWAYPGNGDWFAGAGAHKGVRPEKRRWATVIRG